MKKYLLFIAAIVGLNANMNAQTWSAETQIDKSAGTYPRVLFDPNGKIMVFYYDVYKDSMLLSHEKSPKSGLFKNPLGINKGGKNIGIYFESEKDIQLLVSRSTSHTLMQSADSGKSWSFIKNIPSTDNMGSTNTMGGFFTKDGNDLRLLYSFVHYSAVTGDRPQTFQIKRVGNTWDNTGTFITDGAPIGAYEKDQEVCLLTSRGTYFSSDNGANYTGFTPDRIDATGSDFSNGKIHLIDEVVSTVSSDNGASWSSPKDTILPTVNTVSYSKIAVNGDTIVTCWVEDPSPEPGVGGYRLLLSSYSIDGGGTFSIPDTLFKGTNFKVIKTSYDDNRVDFDIINNRNRFVVAYSTVLNNLNNNQHTYLREINFPEVTPPPPTPTSLENNYISSTEFLVYPNPAQNTLSINLPGNELFAIELFDVYGQKIWATQNVNTQCSIDVSKLASGNYVVKAISKIEQFSKMITINN